MFFLLIDYCMYHEITVLKARQGILGLYYVQKQGIMVCVQEHSYHSAINEWMVHH